MKQYTILLFWILLGHFSFGQIPDEFMENMHIRNIGPAGMSGRVTSIDVDLSNPQKIYAGTSSGGVWLSESGGIRWKPIFDQQPVQSIGAIAVCQQNPSIIWAGTGEGNPRNSHNSGEGIYKSIDGGHSWQLMGLEKTRIIHRILIHPHKPNVVYVAAMGSAWGNHPERGVYKTTDGGETWKKILYINDQTGAADLVMDPSNPDKLIVAMWEFGRKPWFFTSGGEGSGMYITFDGGKTWKERTDKQGLPAGTLGRMGLAIAPSKPNVVYALVEAEKNGLYRSDDGGMSWKLQAEKNIGNRPFYYADIFVDPQNENRLYNLHSLVSKSEDGGKTFEVIMPYNKAHPDHHAFWIHPDNPAYLIDGNDGGLNISHDGGKNWRFIENLPLAQFYHINYDMDTPYNIYGGMQDNGSWVGPSEVWQNGGIRNAHWEELVFGDGFDVVPYPKDNRYGYAMYQGGNVYWYDRKSGRNEYIQPVHPEGVTLRFNWNAGMAIDPFNADALYFGSQFVHHSTDHGKSWQIISPDLTTNDSSKQKQEESGGLTIDATRAENYTSILCISPSPKDQSLIWVGTDDGNVQITRDGGSSWTNVADRLKGLPKGSWISQIILSPHNQATAFVVANNYRRNDWTPYLYRTDDYGKSWKRLVDASNVSGHCLSFTQDPEEADLMFLGTDYGLYVSIDGGTKWQRCPGLPAVSTRDLKIHPREHDLIIGTFGRAAWIMDDVRPLREMAKSNGKMVNQDFAVLHAVEGIVIGRKPAQGVRFTADAHYIGQNSSPNAFLSCWIKEMKEDEKKKGEKEEEEKKTLAPKGKIKVEIYDAKGKLIRNFTTKADTGLNRVQWNLQANGVQSPSYTDPKPDADPPTSAYVIPGTYKAVLSYQNWKDSTSIEVSYDSRIPSTQAQLEARAAFMAETDSMLARFTKAFNRLKEAQKSIVQINQLLEQQPNLADSLKKSLKKEGSALNDSLQNLMNLFIRPQEEKGVDRITPYITYELYNLKALAYGNIGEPGGNAMAAWKVLQEKADQTMQRLNFFFEQKWRSYQVEVEKIDFSLFKEYDKL